MGRVTIEIDEEGATVHVDGIKGARCADLSALFDKLGERESSKKTEEYYEEEVRVATIRDTL